MATGLIFHCDACGARFEVDPALAGKRARCQGCGARTTIPAPGAAAGAAAGFALAPAAAPARAEAPPRAPARPPNWIEAVNSQVGLAPLSVAAIPAFRRGSAPSPLDDASSSALYRVLSAQDLPAVGPAGAPGRPAGAAVVAYRRRLLGLQRLFRWLNQGAYFISVPFLVVLFLGVAVRNRPLVYLGATVVVLLNVGRFASGLANLVVIPFRDNPLKGVLFLFPPYTLYYLWANWGRVRKPVYRIAEPLLTLGLVVGAFAYVPFLAGDRPAPSGDVRTRLEAGARGLREGVETKVGPLPDVDVKAGVDAVEGRARRVADDLRNRAGGPPPSAP
jgi:hypothetical protein